MISVRRLYADIVRGRTTVRIVQASEPQGTEVPIFIVSPYRSGSTLLRLILDSHSMLAAPPEMSVFGHVDNLLSDETTLKGFAGLGFDRHHLTQKTAQNISYFYESYAKSVGKKRWADKSPEHALHLGLIHELYPSAQFLMLSRYPLDQIASMVNSSSLFSARLRPYAMSPSEDLRIAGARYWDTVVEHQMRFEQQHPESCIRVRYEDLCEAPERELKRLISFLKEDWEPQVLQSHRFQHDFGMSDDRARLSREIAVSSGKFEDWQPQIVESCLQITAENRSKLGWGSS